MTTDAEMRKILMAENIEITHGEVVDGDIDKLIAKLQALLLRERKAEIAVIKQTYADWYNKLSKEHDVQQEVPHTAFHQIMEERIKELSRLSGENNTNGDKENG